MKLTTLFRDGRPATELVAFGQDLRRSFGELEASVAALAGAIEAEGSRGERWLLHASNAWSFTVGLLGLWHAGRTAVLPPNAEAGTLGRLTHAVTGAVSDREDVPSSRRVLHPLRPTRVQDRHQIVSLGELDPAHAAVELFTSGTTGDGRVVAKTVFQLASEVETLEDALGADCGEACVFATAVPQPLYGLLFRVLWPLAASRPFRIETYLHPEELAPRMKASGDCVLVGTPAHLRRMKELPDLAKLRGVCRRVFSSGGPLDEETADAYAAALGEAPVEIFGSTETGGVALRQQSPGEHRLAWTPLPRVQVAATPDGRARVRSPFVSAGDPEAGFVMGDRIAELGDGRFVLEGRTDRVIKVGEKRLALPDMENALRGHGWVSDVALLPLGPVADVRVAAVVVLSPEGRDALEHEGRRTVSAALAARLGPLFDRVLLPRAHRYVDDLPRDERGKTTVAALAGLFAPDEGLPCTEPERISERRSPGRLERGLRVPLDLAFLEGHFPELPIVPGVVQLRWALAIATDLLGRPPRVARVEALKFKDLLRPGQVFRAAVTLDAQGEGFEFRLTGDEDASTRVFSSGRCVLASEEAGA